MKRKTAVYLFGVWWVWGAFLLDYWGGYPFEMGLLAMPFAAIMVCSFVYLHPWSDRVFDD